MTTITESKPWDFSQVFEFTNAYTPKPNAVADAYTPPAAQDAPIVPRSAADDSRHEDVSIEDDSIDSAALGNFSKVWQFLGVPNHNAHGKLQNDPALALNSIKDDYASDGAAYQSKSLGNTAAMQWSDGTDAEESGSVTSTATPMTKTQRKRAKRKEKKAAVTTLPANSGVVSESEVEHISRQTPAKKASAHIFRSSTPTPTPTALQRPAARSSTPLPQGSAVLSEESARRAVEAVAKATAAIKNEQHYTTATPRTPGTGRHTPTAATQRPRPAPLPKSSSAAMLLPASIMPTTPRQKSNNITASPGLAAAASSASSPSRSPINVPFPQPASPGWSRSRRPNPPPSIEPHIIRSGEDRHWALLMKIIGDFYEDRKHLVAPMTLTTHNNDPDGIHLFVDASNVFIGFMNQLKLSRGIHPMHHMPQANLSFDGLALLMERRRPVARRILVGSTPHLPAFDKAKAVGYECNILEKVYKARELTERQIYFRESDARRFGRPLRMTPGQSATTAFGSSPVSTSANGVFGSGSGNTPLFDPPKMIEQGVDEILHMKMLESIVDVERPSTMVLATGDAAAAEYSPGFQAMVLRALNKGWRVELISWSKSISSHYTKKAWTDKWGGMFRIIFLDDYAEELLDMDATS